MGWEVVLMKGFMKEFMWQCSGGDIRLKMLETSASAVFHIFFQKHAPCFLLQTNAWPVVISACVSVITEHEGLLIQSSNRLLWQPAVQLCGKNIFRISESTGEWKIGNWELLRQFDNKTWKLYISRGETHNRNTHKTTRIKSLKWTLSSKYLTINGKLCLLVKIKHDAWAEAQIAFIAIPSTQRVPWTLWTCVFGQDLEIPNGHTSPHMHPQSRKAVRHNSIWSTKILQMTKVTTITLKTEIKKHNK